MIIDFLGSGRPRGPQKPFQKPCSFNVELADISTPTNPPAELGTCQFFAFITVRNSASGPEIVFPIRISAGFWFGELQNRVSEGRPKGRF